MTDSEVLRDVPIAATYRIVDSAPVLVSAEYRDVPIDAFIGLLRAGGLIRQADEQAGQREIN